MKNYEIIAKKEHFCLCEVGRELLKIEIKTVDIIKNEEKECKVERVVRFCQEIVNNCKNYAEGRLFDIIKAEYKKIADEGCGRDFKKYVYRISCDLSEGEEYALIAIEAALLRSGRVIKQKSISRKWDLKRGVLVPIYNRKKKDEKGAKMT